MENAGLAQYQNYSPNKLVMHFDRQRNSALATIKNTGELLNKNEDESIDIGVACLTLENNLTVMEAIHSIAVDWLEKEGNCYGCDKQKCIAWGASILDTFAGITTIVVNFKELTAEDVDNDTPPWGLACLIGTAVIAKIRDRIWWKRVEWIRMVSKLEKLAASTPEIEHIRSTLKAFKAYQGLLKEQRELSDTKLQRYLRRIRRVPKHFELDRVQLAKSALPAMESKKRQRYIEYVRKARFEEELANETNQAFDRLSQNSQIPSKTSWCGARQPVDSTLTLKQSSNNLQLDDFDEEFVDLEDYYERSIWGSYLNTAALEEDIASEYAEAQDRIAAVGSMFETLNPKDVDLRGTLQSLKKNHEVLMLYFAIIHKIAKQERRNSSMNSRRVNILLRSVLQGALDICSVSLMTYEEESGSLSSNGETATFALVISSQVFSKIHDYFTTRVVVEEDLRKDIERLQGQRVILTNVQAMYQTFSAIQNVVDNRKASLVEQENALMACRVPMDFRPILNLRDMELSVASQIDWSQIPEAQEPDTAIGRRLQYLWKRKEQEVQKKPDSPLKSWRIDFLHSNASKGLFPTVNLTVGGKKMQGTEEKKEFSSSSESASTGNGKSRSRSRSSLERRRVSSARFRNSKKNKWRHFSTLLQKSPRKSKFSPRRPVPALKDDGDSDSDNLIEEFSQRVLMKRVYPSGRNTKRTSALENKDGEASAVARVGENHSISEVSSPESVTELPVTPLKPEGLPVSEEPVPERIESQVQSSSEPIFEPEVKEQSTGGEEAMMSEEEMTLKTPKREEIFV